MGCSRRERVKRLNHAIYIYIYIYIYNYMYPPQKKTCLVCSLVLAVNLAFLVLCLDPSRDSSPCFECSPAIRRRLPAWPRTDRVFLGPFGAGKSARTWGCLLGCPTQHAGFPVLVGFNPPLAQGNLRRATCNFRARSCRSVLRVLPSYLTNWACLKPWEFLV